jgi:flagellar biosynthesis protein FlhB
VSDDLDRRVHEPTPKRVADFRKRGEVALSRDLVAVATLMGGLLAAIALGPRIAGALGDHMRETLAGLDGADPGRALRGVLGAVAGAALPLAGVALAAALVTGLAQLGWPPVLRAPRFDLARLLSARALADAFAPKAAAGRLVKSLAKLALVGLVGALAVRAEHRRFLSEPALDPGHLAQRLAAAAARVACLAGGALALLAAIDWTVARRRLTARMRMTPEEMKREHREQEGDPQVRRRRRLRMRELARRRLPQAVKGADVVIVNPTEYAVALRYRGNEDRAPRVVAKGRGPVAERIRELARGAGVPILPQPPLARLIHKLVPEGREIPPNLYAAVAEVLAYVYRLRRRSGGR